MSWRSSPRPGIRAETDLRNEKINYKVREHSLAKVPNLLVVGKREADEGHCRIASSWIGRAPEGDDDRRGHKYTSTTAYAPGAAIAPLGRFKAPLGTIAVLGNHDVWTSPLAFADALHAQHITLLTKQAVRRGPLIIGGTDEGFAEGFAAEPTLKAMNALGPGPKILLTHVPNVARSLRQPIAAVLAGHTHCGQIVLPFYGSIGRDKGMLRWLPCGRVDLKSGPLFVTAGVGTSILPLRLGARPDVWLIRFGPAR
jgi:hypothetical protein